VIKVDVNTGHILQINGDLYIGNGEVFNIFSDFDKVENYIYGELGKNDNLEFVIYDCTGKGVRLINRFEDKQIE
jgi:hypothetical protein